MKRDGRAYRWRPDIKTQFHIEAQKTSSKELVFFVYDHIGRLKGEYPEAQARRMTEDNDWTIMEKK